jgi:CDP-4-dehydro-6-deoxyglucose reductase
MLCPVRARSGAPVQRIVIEMPPGFRFRAGQYLEVLHPDGAIPLSIASGPRRLPDLHLHYRSTPGVREAAWMDELLDAGRPLRVLGPAGDVCLPDDSHIPLLLIAGGTGMAQVCAMLDELRGRPTRARVDVLWCADSTEDLYCRMDLETAPPGWLQVENAVDARRDAANAGLLRVAELADALRAQPGSAPWILLAGSPGFVHAVADIFESAGLDPACAHSDVFAWAPRPSRPT